MTLSACIRSMRLRTLPLSLSGVVAGIFIAASQTELRPLTVVFLLLTTVLLQILTNLSNELGDTLSGTDREDRSVARYSLQDGEITIEEMKRLIASVVVLTCLSGMLMIWLAMGSLLKREALFLLVLGALAVLSAMRYTLGRHPYGYRGLGDFYVFLFFGLVSVCGGYYVCTLDFNLMPALLPACTIGCFSVGVLNVNNIRDMKSDAATRMTMAIRLGETWARVYQTVLICGGWALIIVYTLQHYTGPLNFLYVLTLPAYLMHLKGTWKRRDSDLDPMLPLLVLGTFVFSLLFGTGLLISFAP